MCSSCVGPVQDSVGTDFRAARIAHYAQIAAQLGTPYADVDSKERRNQFIDEFVAIKNLQFHNYVTAIRRGTSYGQLTADGTRLVLDSLAALTGGLAVKSALAAASAGVTGFTSSIQKDVLFDQSVPTFIAKMEELRANKLADIINKKDLSIAEYTPSQAFNDVEEYGADGAFDAALQSINVQVGRAAAQAKADLSEAKGDTISAAATEALNRPVRQPTALDSNKFSEEQGRAQHKPTPSPGLPSFSEFAAELRALDNNIPNEKKKEVYGRIFNQAAISPTPDQFPGLNENAVGANIATLSQAYQHFQDKQRKLNELVKQLTKEYQATKTVPSQDFPLPQTEPSGAPSPSPTPGA
jgi:hypothetical protein